MRDYSPEERRVMEQFYDTHAMTPDELRFLMRLRRLSPAEQAEVLDYGRYLQQRGDRE